VRSERRQCLHYVLALLLLETRTQTKDVPPEDFALFVLGFAHRCLVSGVLPDLCWPRGRYGRVRDRHDACQIRVNTVDLHKIHCTQ
jgi:hypothetical protein